MNAPLRRLLPSLMTLALASPATQAEIFKCREGTRVTYQERPCPNASQAAAPLELQAQPSAYEVEQARVRAQNEIKEAAALRKRDDQATQAQEKKRATMAKQGSACERLRGKIVEAEHKETLTKPQKIALKSERRKYQKECGPL
jgi:hypothetical protein